MGRLGRCTLGYLELACYENLRTDILLVLGILLQSLFHQFLYESSPLIFAASLTSCVPGARSIMGIEA